MIKRNSKGQFIKGVRSNLKGEFQKGNEGFWLGKKRPNVSGKNNWKWTNKITYKICLYCGKTFFVRGNEKRKLARKFCCHLCSLKYHRGDKNNNWKGGINKGKDRLRSSEYYKEWRMKVFQRDRFTCKWCGHRSKKSKAHGDKRSDIEAHHIITMEENIKLCLKVGNGITLCEKCHKLTYGKEEKFAKAFKEILRDYTPNIPKG